MEAIEQVGLRVATDHQGECCEKMVAYVKEPVHVWRNDSFVAAFPSQEVGITYGIDFQQVLAWRLSGLVAWSVVLATCFVRDCQLIMGLMC